MDLNHLQLCPMFNFLGVPIRLKVIWSLSLVLVLLWLPEALTVQRLPCHLHYGLNLWIHVEDTSLASTLLVLKHKTQESTTCFILHVTKETAMK